MTKRERSSRPDRPSRERSLDALLDRDSRDRAAGAPGRTVTPPGGSRSAQVLAALTSVPESSELTGEARALAEFRAFAESGAFAGPGRSGGPAQRADLPAPRRDPGRMTWRPGGRPAVAAATGAVLMGGLLAVAYAGDLPAPGPAAGP